MSDLITAADNLRALADWFREHGSDEADHIVQDLRRIASDIEDGTTLPSLPEWKVF